MVRFFALATSILLTGAALIAQTAPTNPAPAQKSVQNPWEAPPQSGKRVFRYQFETPAGTSTSQVFAVLNPTGPSCPVTMRAEHRSGGSVMTTGRGAASGVGQRIHLIFGETGVPARVTAARVTVRGTNGQWRILAASGTESRQGSPYISRTLYPVFSEDGEGMESADLELPGFSSVKSIRLDSVTYADGSTWTPMDGGSCRVEPDPLMLVSSR
jgi:hypothetical protein